MNKLPIGASGIIKVTDNQNGNITIDIDPTYRGQVSINTVGTIKEGDWQANIIEPKYGGTGCDNGEAFIKLKGNVNINGSLVIDCENNTNVLIPKNGTIAIKEDSLQCNNNLNDICDFQKAYNNISPNKEDGDITYFYKGSNQVLKIGAEDAVLNVKNGQPFWDQLPSFYHTVQHNYKTLPQKDTMHFLGHGFKLHDHEKQIDQDSDEEKSTNIKLHDYIESLSKVEGKGGILIIDTAAQKDSWLSPPVNYIQTRELKTGNGIIIDNENGINDNPTIAIHPGYQGQNSISNLGIVNKGKWNAETISPEFGGTGCKNVHPIILGGTLDTECEFTIRTINSNGSLHLYVNGQSNVLFPNNGTLATIHESLQCIHNLHDLENPTEAFRHISPTKKRGDIIARGYGDYDINVPIGEQGQVLTVNKDKPGYIEWQDLNLREKIEEVVNIMFAKKEKAEQDKALSESNNKKLKLDSDKYIKAIMLQLDFLARTNQIKPIAELKSVLQEFFNSLK